MGITNGRWSYKSSKQFLDLVCILTPLMASSSGQCAVAEDGSLLDASKIIFYNDPDDDNPLPNTVSEPISTTSRRSGRVTRPSARIMDPDNLEASVLRKRSATVTTSIEGSVRAARRAKRTLSVDETEDEDKSGCFEVEVDTVDDDDVGMADITTDEDGVRVGEGSDSEQVQEDYLATKAMGDADRQVCISLFHEEY